ncbi:YbcC family protein [Roseovarius ramblicola]|uniref:Probable inorganic carbon transporter subunit DabA n=1 Tax=Roseovarius ramblicola TaxID=2022336 RepID=A0ABV5I0H7_9RHOB
MFLKHTQIAADRVSGLLTSAEAAARAIPPAFPLDATVAVNPFLGQAQDDLATASARLARVAGVRLTRPRAEYAAQMKAGGITDDDLAAALFASASPLKPADLALVKAKLAAESPAPQALPTVAELASEATGTDWPAVIARSLGLWAAGHFDRGQALWTPAPGRGAFAAWREWATHDLTPEIAGLTGFCAHVAAAPDTAERAILRAAERLGLTETAAETAFHRLLMDLGGWAQHARWMLWQAEMAGESDTTITDLLAIRMIWEEALLEHAPQVAGDWRDVVAAHAEPVAPTPDQAIDAILQDAAERSYQRRLSAALTGAKAQETRPALQAAFCIDVRSEVFRRALEAQGGAIETIGFAGFFGLPLAHKPQGTDLAQAHLPVLLKPALTSCSHAGPETEEETRIAARAVRAWGRFRQAAVSSFAFVEAAGPAYGWKLVRDALALGEKTRAPEPAPRIEGGLSAARKAGTAAAVLRAMSLTTGHARLVLLLGHGANVANNPHESAYHCGACGGQTGAVSARLLAALLNDPETRAGLSDHGIALPGDTLFMAGLHDTTTDAVTLYEDTRAPDHAADIAQARAWLDAAGGVARAERAGRLPGARPDTVARRARDWAELRPEWGLAGCAAFVAAPRGASAGADLGGRAFLHSYDWRADAGFATLELILTAPVVVASWISLQYYGATVAPAAFGGGNKRIHNVVGGIGVVQGNGGILRPGLPWQAVHDGERAAHETLRLTVMIEAPREAIGDVLARHGEVRTLFDNGWLHLLALEGGRVAARYRPGLEWEVA